MGEQVPIVALTTGTVVQVTAYVGQNITQPTNKLMTIGDRLVFMASLDQRYFSSVNVGDRAKIYLRALDGATLEGRVIQIGPSVNATSSAGAGGIPQVPFTFPVWLDVDTGGRKLANGMNGYCVFSREVERLAIPQAALMRYSGGEGVVGIVDADHRAQFVPVTYSINAEGWIAIGSGVSPGDLLLTAGQTGLREGDKVTFQPPDGRAPGSAGQTSK